MFSSIVSFFYPSLSKEEISKFSLYGLAAFFTLGTYWILRLLKDVLIYKTAFPAELGWVADYGRVLVPTLKLSSFILAFVVVFVYGKLVDSFKKHQLFYVIGSFYMAIFSLVAIVLFLNATYGSAFVGWLPLAISGVAAYLATETFGSMMIALFWSFTISTTSGDSAKRGFPFIVALIQVGTIGGSALVYTGIETWQLFCISVLSLSGILFTIRHIAKNHVDEEATTAKDATAAKPEKKKKPDFMAGITLLLQRPYLLGVMIVSTFYEVAKSVVDYQMKSQAAVSGFNFQRFLGIYGMSVNLLALAMALLGTSFLMQRMGLRFCLLLYPAMFGSSMIGLYFYYLTGPTPEALLWATFGVMMLVTALSYAVNNPTKEMMYIPTSKDAKFKVKGLIDMFGTRTAKMGGMQIGGGLNVPGNPTLSIANLMGMGTLISLGFIGVWFAVAIYVGQKNAQLVKDGEIVE